MNFYTQLRDVISSYHHRDKLILTGDFSAGIGTDYQAWEGILSRHSAGRINARGCGFYPSARNSV